MFHPEKGKLYASKANFASTNHSMVNLLKSRESADSLGTRIKCNPIEDARNEYLMRRGNVLDDFEERRTYPNESTEDQENPVLSANGDVKNDFTLLERAFLPSQRKKLKDVLLDIYGTDSLASNLDDL